MPQSRSIIKWATDYRNPKSIGSRLRARRIRPLTQVIRALFAEKSSVSIIDIGGSAYYWNILPPGFLEENNVTITVANLPEANLPDNFDRFRFINADGCNLSEIETNAFDIAHSNSVIEHVGDWQKMQQFSKELQRVSKYYYLQTPNFWFPFEPHYMTPFFHWLPRPVRAWILMHFAIGHCDRITSLSEAMLILEDSELLTTKMLRELFPGASIINEKFMFMNKSLVAMNFPLPD